MKDDDWNIQHRRVGTRDRREVETIRYYERIGLLPPPARTGGNYRAYAQPHLDRLSFIRRGRDLGFSLDDVRELLRLSDDRQRPCGEIDQIARERLADVECKLADLTVLRGELRQLIDQCHRGTVAECRIIEALAPRAATGKVAVRPKGTFETRQKSRIQLVARVRLRKTAGPECRRRASEEPV